MSLRRSAELLTRLEKHALDQERLALQALEGELARLQQELAAAGQRLAAEHVAAWDLPGGPRRLAAYRAGEAARLQTLLDAARHHEQAVAQAQMGLQGRLRSYKALELAARGMAARAAAQQMKAQQAEVDEAGATRAAAR